jgi:enoyl-CoA hydratase
MTDEVLFEKRGRAMLVTLNRPKQLNALNLAMYRRLGPALEQWQEDPTIESVVLRGAGPKAFSAGGDIRSLYDLRDSESGPGDLRTQLFVDEYRFVIQLHDSPKPFVSLTHGITFGGGAGLSVNARYRTVSERTLFSMPEVFIGSIPDIGASSFFNLCPGYIGMYLALTGARINAADAVACGLYSHLIPEARLDALTERIGELPREEIPGALAQFAIAPEPSALLARQPEIDRCFGLSSVEEIDAAVREEAKRTNAEWARAAVDALDRASPLSLKLTYHLIQQGKGSDLAQALTLEYRILHHVLEGHDFYSGVKAVVVDKSRFADWKYKSLKEVPDEEVERHFAHLGERELQLGDN